MQFGRAMAFKTFTIPIRDSEASEADLNAFLRSHKVLSVDRIWVDQGSNSFWSFCVDYLESAVGSTGSSHRRDRQKIDYRDVLSPEDFAVFAKLRELRKDIAQAEAVPVYTIFTNEQLAQMVQKQARTNAILETIAGIGDARIEKYGARFLDFLKTQWGGDHETDGGPV